MPICRLKGILKLRDLQAGPCAWTTEASWGKMPLGNHRPWGFALLPTAGSHAHIPGPLGHSSELRDSCISLAI